MSWVRAPHWVLCPFLYGFSLSTLVVGLALFTFQKVRIGPVVRIPRFHRGGRGSIPRCGGFVFVLQAPVCGVFLSNTHTDQCILCLYPSFNLFCCRDSLFSLFPAFIHQLVLFLSMKWQKNRWIHLKSPLSLSEWNMRWIVYSMPTHNQEFWADS